LNPREQGGELEMSADAGREWGATVIREREVRGRDNINGGRSGARAHGVVGR